MSERVTLGEAEVLMGMEDRGEGAVDRLMAGKGDKLAKTSVGVPCSCCWW